MVTLDTRSPRGATIDDRRRSHTDTVTSPSGVQETGCGTGALSTVYGIGVGHLADGSAVPMATAITSGLVAVVAFALLRRRG